MEKQQREGARGPRPQRRLPPDVKINVRSAFVLRMPEPLEARVRKAAAKAGMQVVPYIRNLLAELHSS